MLRGSDRVVPAEAKPREITKFFVDCATSKWFEAVQQACVERNFAVRSINRSVRNEILVYIQHPEDLRVATNPDRRS